MMRRLYVPRFFIETETVWPILEDLWWMKLDDISFNRWHSQVNNDTGSVLSIQIPDGHESKNSWVLPYYLRLQCQKQDTARIMRCIFSDYNPSWFSDCSNLFLVQLAKSESGIQHAFDSKTLATAKRYLDSAAALQSVVVVSDLIAIVSTTAEIFTR